MPTCGRFVIILLIFGAAAHIFLGGGLSFISDYRIWRPIIETSRQEIILVHNTNNNNSRNSTKIPLNVGKFHLTSAAPVDNSISIPSKFYKLFTNNLLNGKLANVYSAVDKSIATASTNDKLTETFSETDGNIRNIMLNTSTG